MNVPHDLNTSRRLICETRQAIDRLEAASEVERQLRDSMIRAARVIESHHAVVALIEGRSSVPGGISICCLVRMGAEVDLQSVDCRSPGSAGR